MCCSNKLSYIPRLAYKSATAECGVTELGLSIRAQVNGTQGVILQFGALLAMYGRRFI